VVTRLIRSAKLLHAGPG